MGAVLDWLLSGHTGNWQDYLIRAVFAFLGAASCAFAVNPKIKLPTRKGNEYDLGFVQLLLVGTAAGVAVGHAPPVPYFVGLLAPVVVPFFLKKTIPSILAVVTPVVTGILEAYMRKRGER